MNWVKTTIVDVAVTACIVAAAFMDVEWARWVIWIYTPFILLLKIGAFFGPTVVKRGAAKKEEAPEWFYHVLYAANVVLLLAARWWLVAGGWALIWLISYLALRKK